MAEWDTTAHTAKVLGQAVALRQCIAISRPVTTRDQRRERQEQQADEPTTSPDGGNDADENSSSSSAEEASSGIDSDHEAPTKQSMQPNANGEFYLHPVGQCQSPGWSRK